MAEHFDRRTVLDLLTELDRRDSGRRVFGSGVHDYKLRPPLTHAAIETFEGRHAVTLPEDYRCFITEIGDGGAGPYYGLFHFGQHDHCHDYCAWEDGGLVGDLSNPFPHMEAWNLPDSFWEGEPDLPPDLPDEEQDRLMEAWDRELEGKYWAPSIMDGAIPICHLGCAQRHWLVINGDEKGHVWGDDRADSAGIYPVLDGTGRRMTFFDWYMTWLNEALRNHGQSGRIVPSFR